MDTDEHRWKTIDGGVGTMDDRSALLGELFREDGVGLPPSELTQKIIGCAYKVGNALGPGFLEKVYENALTHELRKSGLMAEQQVRVDVYYDGVLVGYYDADIIVDTSVIIEVKAVRCLEDAHKARSLNYLKATGIRLGLLFQFRRLSC